VREGPTARLDAGCPGTRQLNTTPLRFLTQTAARPGAQIATTSGSVHTPRLRVQIRFQHRRAAPLHGRATWQQTEPKQHSLARARHAHLAAEQRVSLPSTLAAASAHIRAVSIASTPRSREPPHEQHRTMQGLRERTSSSACCAIATEIGGAPATAPREDPDAGGACPRRFPHSFPRVAKRSRAAARSGSATARLLSSMSLQPPTSDA